MNHSYLPYVRRNSVISLVLVMMGSYTLHIAPRPGPNSFGEPSVTTRMMVIVGIFLFACASFIEVASLVRLFEPKVSRLASPYRLQHLALVVFAVAGIVAVVYAAIYVLIPTLDVVWPWLATIIFAASSSLAVAHWADSQMRERKFY